MGYPIAQALGVREWNWKRAKPTDDEREANARLIAAAPDLLEALKEALPAMRLFYSFYGDDEHTSGVEEAVGFRAAMTAVEAAIRKAEGA